MIYTRALSTDAVGAPSPVIGQNSGFSLMEVLVSLTMFSLVSAGLAPSFIGYLKRNTDSQRASEAMAVAQAKLDQLRHESPQDMPVTGSDPAEYVSIDGKSYQIVTSYCLRAELCISNNARHISVVVSLNNKELFNAETVFTTLR